MTEPTSIMQPLPLPSHDDVVMGRLAQGVAPQYELACELLRQCHVPVSEIHAMAYRACQRLVAAGKIELHICGAYQLATKTPMEPKDGEQPAAPKRQKLAPGTVIPARYRHLIK